MQTDRHGHWCGTETGIIPGHVSTLRWHACQEALRYMFAKLGQWHMRHDVLVVCFAGCRFRTFIISRRWNTIVGAVFMPRHSLLASNDSIRLRPNLFGPRIASPLFVGFTIRSSIYEKVPHSPTMCVKRGKGQVGRCLCYFQVEL